jgi:hypothetical protein
MKAVRWAVGLLMIGAATTGCAAGFTQGYYASHTAGAIGCPESEVEVSGTKFVQWAHEGNSWSATCRGRRFICSFGVSPTCSPELEAAAPGAPAVQQQASPPVP